MLTHAVKTGLMMILIGVLAACGGDSTAESATSGDPSPTGLSASISPSATSSSDAIPTPSVSTVTGDIIATTKSAEKSIKKLMGQGIGVQGGGGMCELGVGAIIESAGSTVELSLPDGQKFVSRLLPSPINGKDIPCQLEAVFEGVPIPDDASLLTFTSLGGANVYTKQTATIEGRKLIRNGFTVELD